MISWPGARLVYVTPGGLVPVVAPKKVGGTGEAATTGGTRLEDILLTDVVDLSFIILVFPE